MKEKKNLNAAEHDIMTLMAEYNKQVNNSTRHAYSETLHHDDGSCFCCDCMECGCDTMACCTSC